MPKTINVGFITSLLVLVVILAEVYLSYVYLYQNLNPQPQVQEVNKNTIRVNLTAEIAASKYLDSLDTFQPLDLTTANPNPFLYSK
ncbi:MAG: hypothetical protein ABI643_03255 [Candidatus Doudnabacteria bacterium]